MSKIDRLLTEQDRFDKVQQEKDYYKSLVDAFFEGCVPESEGNLQHFIMAKYGRLRHESMGRVPRLLEATS